MYRCHTRPVTLDERAARVEICNRSWCCSNEGALGSISSEEATDPLPGRSDQPWLGHVLAQSPASQV